MKFTYNPKKMIYTITKSLKNLARLFNSHQAKLTLFLYFCYILFPSISYADSVYQNCIYGNQADFIKGDKALPSSLYVRPIGEECYKNCQSECASAFGLPVPLYSGADNTDLQKSVDSGGKNGPDKRSFDEIKEIEMTLQLNNDLIGQCIQQCQAGQIFSAKKRIYKTSTEQESDKASQNFDIKPYTEGQYVQTKSHCSSSFYATNSPQYPYDSKFLVKGNSGAKISINSPSSSPNQEANDILGDTIPNTIYMLGRKYITIYPENYSTKNIRNPNNSREPNKWNANNTDWTETGIWILNGDYLSIEYKGRYHSKCSNNKCTVQINDYDLLFADKSSISQNPSLPASKMSDSLRPFMQPAQDNDQTIPTQNIEYCGLQAMINGTSLPADYLSDYSVDSSQYNAKTFPSIRFNGSLQDFTNGGNQKYTQLLIKHPNAISSSMGGYTVSLGWRGFPNMQGQRLQYLFVAPKDTANQITLTNALIKGNWIDLTFTKDQSDSSRRGQWIAQTAVSIDDMYLYLRIKPLEKTELQQKWDNPDNTGINWNSVPFGGYDLSVSKMIVLKNDDVISKLLGRLKRNLFGGPNGKDDSGKMPVVNYIYENFIKNNGYISAIRALVTFYIAYTGLMFVAGMAQFTQQEAVKRIVKMAFVLTLIGDTSWNFFGIYLTKLFVNGMDSLIDIVTAPTLQWTFGLDPADINSDVRPIIATSLSGIWGRIWQNDLLWTKVLSIIFVGFSGFFAFLCIVIALITFSITLLSALLIYLISVLGIALMISIAPLTIPMCLFGYTKQIFDSWIKQLTSFMLQPVAVFGAISLFQKLMMGLLGMVLNFAVCDTCIINLFGSCLWTMKVPLIAAHYPPDGILGPNFFGAGISFLIIGHAMFNFVKLMSELTARLIDWTTASAAQGTGGGLAGFVSPITSAIGTSGKVTGTILGVDKHSVETREKEQKKQDKKDRK